MHLSTLIRLRTEAAHVVGGGKRRGGGENGPALAPAVGKVHGAVSAAVKEVESRQAAGAAAGTAADAAAARVRAPDRPSCPLPYHLGRSKKGSGRRHVRQAAALPTAAAAAVAAAPRDWVAGMGEEKGRGPVVDWNQKLLLRLPLLARLHVGDV